MPTLKDDATRKYHSEFWLAVLVGLTLALGLAPSIYSTYFIFIGWPSYYNGGPLYRSGYSDFLCCENSVLLFVFPLITWLLLATRPQVNQPALIFLYSVLPLIQIYWGMLNILLLLRMN